MAVAPKQIFMSHGRAERSVAQRLAERFKKLGLSVWIDSDVAAGADWNSEIRQGLDESDAFVMVLGSEHSAWSRFELSEVAKRTWKDADAFVVPVLVNEAATPPGFLRDQEYVRLHDETDRSLDQAAEQIRHLWTIPHHSSREAGEQRRLERVNEIRTAALAMTDENAG